MADQAEALRKRLESKDIGQSGPTKVVAIVSGKGGVGKSNVAVNTSIRLQQLGKRVLIIDLDIGMANIDILLGETSSSSVVDMLNKEQSIWSIMESGPLGLTYVAGGSGLNQLFEMDDTKSSFFYRQLESLDQQFDYIFLDMGAGVTEDSFHFLLAAHEVILVTTPEPTSITDAYAMLKYITLKDETLPISMIVNRASSDKDGKQTYQNLQNVAQQFLQKELTYLSSIMNDQIVWKAVRKQRPYLLFAPKSKPSEGIKNVVDAFLLQQGQTVESSEEPFANFLTKLKGFMRSKKEG
ncbi:MinD/ParA family protein [Paenalkalicoccus suaedae]|uniref:MinD/ParA family protein n=1 Tax=Paenalkalicoccus suaedae TaxID=2592382 RepID=A0A859FDZ9_9BACI|nr:MinD/ParA family protein [Paenalkalicoccus suaedae]QKS71419.1 MinD/ParA family protein [Paenalkalicoccus suaedae]